MMRTKTSLITLALLTTAAIGLAPTTSAESEDDCAADCLDSCFLYLRTSRFVASCSVGHTPYTLESDCFFNDCGKFVAYCVFITEYGQIDPNCDVTGDVPVDPLCQRLFYGPDIDNGYCVDFNNEDCLVWRYDTYGTAGGYQCYVRASLLSPPA